MKLFPIVLSGGSGTRLWPLSREALPKQLLPLISKNSMLQETVARLVGLPTLASVTVVCNADHRFMVSEQFTQMQVTPLKIVLEPAGRNTAPAVAVAAMLCLRENPEAILLVLPADHLIQDTVAFHQAVKQAERLAEQGHLVTFGILPSGPETCYGYIEQGQPIEGFQHANRVSRFVEKPDFATAQEFINAGTFFWNSGMFVLRADRYLEELQRHCPGIFVACQAAVEGGYQDLEFWRLDADAFLSCPSDSVDYAVMEKTDNAVVLAVDVGWNDIGSWSSLWSVGAGNEKGNVMQGDVYAEDCTDCLIRSEHRLVTAIGIRDAIIVETSDAVLVVDKGSAQQVKNMVDSLKAQQRSEHINHRRVYRPWGYYENIDDGHRFLVKRMLVKPGAKLSLQMHHHRAEHWVVVRGTAKVTRGEEIVLLGENQSTYIPMGISHRLENPGKIPLEMIEVQSGAYLEEDDIVRFEDIYRRA
jgi:mannose-1-phosphate guanylyltransferase/mannose-6-phosphate isomerase